MSAPQPDLDLAVRFVTQHAVGDYVVLTGILPDGGSTVTRTFRHDEEDEIRNWCATHSGVRNLYFAVNPPRGPTKRKLKKDDVASLTYYHVDCDPREGFDLNAERRRISQLLSRFRPDPTYLIDSGNGFQAFWRVKEPVPNDGDYEALEAVNRTLEMVLGGDGCGNLDRIMRIPGTVNLPNQKKRDLGRVPVVAKLVRENISTVSADDFENPPSHFVDLLAKDKRLKARWFGSSEGLVDTSRSAFDLSLVALLRSRGYSREETEAILRRFPFGKYSEDHDERAFERSWDKAEEGGPRLPKGDEAVEELNASYAVVLTGRRLSVIAEKLTADGARDFDLLGVDAFKGWLANQICLVPNARGDLVRKPVAEVWIKDPRRRQYREIGFWPGRELPGVYNLWRGFAVEPREGDCGPLLEHVLHILCQGEQEHFDFVIGWSAALVQFPARKTGTALVFRGEQGAGKSLFGLFLGGLLGSSHYKPIANSRYITGNFNSHMKGCLLLQCDEGFFAGDPAAEAVLKDLITSPRLAVEFKGQDPVWIDNYVRLMVTSNAEWVVPAGLRERRFATFDVGDARVGNKDYFKRIFRWYEEGGDAAFLHFLINFDLSSVDLLTIPKTAALQDQKAESLPIEQHWLLDLLMRGQLPGDINGVGFAPAALLYDHFVSTSTKIGARRRAWEMAISKMLREWIPDMTKNEGIYVDPRDREQREKRGRIWNFPPLDACRAAFDERTGESWPWEEPDVWLAHDEDDDTF